ncbi:CDP-glycerol glycerophosphotransferase family protein [Treponema denticola]|uniref:CDP-glycerol glycerophosphotransferase family protein n=1 Tax=Treponema denticola TaxID=158 RepID=UPI003D0622B8
MILLLYIDPGTGSILFSIVIGLITTLYFVAKTAFIKLKVAVYKDKAKGSGNKNTIVIYSEGKRYWNVFLPICNEFEEHQKELVFYTSSEDDPVFEQHYTYVKPEYIGKGNKAFARLNMLEADICLMTTPGLDVYQLKRSKHVRHYSHILHALDDATSYRLFGLDYFDSVLLSGEYQVKGIRELESLRNLPPKNLRVVGCPYLDVLSEKIKNLPEKSSDFTVLIAPSWGASGILSKYGEQLITPLVETGWNIIIRPHPQSKTSEPDMLKRLEEKYKDVANFVWDYNSENIDSLSKADIMISDFSSVIFDYCFLFDKPFLYCNNEFDHRPYDSGDLKETPWKFSVLKEIGVELNSNSFDHIKEIISEACKSETLKENRLKAKDTAWQNRGCAGKAVYDFLTEIKTI